MKKFLFCLDRPRIMVGESLGSLTTFPLTSFFCTNSLVSSKYSSNRVPYLNIDLCSIGILREPVKAFCSMSKVNSFRALVEIKTSFWFWLEKSIDSISS